MSIKPKITVIGAANIDLFGYPKEELIFKDSNTGTLEVIFGGVGRNIAENLSRLGFKVEFLSVLGNDDFAKRIIRSCEELDISIKHCKITEEHSTSVFMAIMDNHNDLALGLDAMRIYDQIPDSFILNNLDVIDQNDYCLLETNMPKRILELVTNKLPHIHFALDAVSGKKALKAKSILDKLTILKCNLLEAELLSDIEIKSKNNYKDIVLHFIDLGVSKVFITLGKNGIVYGDSKGFYKMEINYLNPINTTGAGDSFMAGLLYGEIQGFNIHKMVQFANACAQMTVQHKNTVHPEINEKQILKLIS
ncbi:MAG: carbohydrate kinase family protein [Bacteroidota bacterium]